MASRLTIARVFNALRSRFSNWQINRQVVEAYHLLHGPPRVDLADDHAGLVVLAKDAEWFMPSLLEHHFALGVAHIVVVDNGSTDRTAAIAATFPNVTILLNTLPAKKYETRLRALAAERIYRGGWTMFADTDELAEVPGGLTAILRYANAHGYTAIVGQMLDLCAEGDQSKIAGLDYPSAQAACNTWTTFDLHRYTYHDTESIGFHRLLKDNICADPGVELLSGGLRKAVFGEETFLSKHSLVRNTAEIRPMIHPHCAGGVNVADITLCLRHYKLAGDWRARDRTSVSTAVWEHGEDVKRLQVANNSDFSITVPDARRWEGLRPLFDNGFLYASARAKSALIL